MLLIQCFLCRLGLSCVLKQFFSWHFSIIADVRLSSQDWPVANLFFFHQRILDKKQIDWWIPVRINFYFRTKNKSWKLWNACLIYNIQLSMHLSCEKKKLRWKIKAWTSNLNLCYTIMLSVEWILNKQKKQQKKKN